MVEQQQTQQQQAATTQQGETTKAIDLNAFINQYGGGLRQVEGVNTVMSFASQKAAQQSQDVVKAVEKAGGAEESGTVTTYAPWGNYAQIELKDTKLGLSDKPGEVAIFQKATGLHAKYFPDTYYNIGGGGRNAAQSGTFTINAPETPVVYKQESKAKPGFAESANIQEAEKVLAAPKEYSRLGAEAYGGYVTKLDQRTIQSTGAQYSTYANRDNLANFVDRYGVNLKKSEAPGAKIPWEVPASTPAISYMDQRGLIGAQAKSTQETVIQKTQIGEPAYPQKVETQPGFSIENIGASLLARGISPILGTIKSIRAQGEPVQANQTVSSTPIIATTKEISYSGGNQTITEIGSWLEENRNKIDVTSPAEVNFYNRMTDTYNEMSKQNPFVTTEKTTTTTKQATESTITGVAGTTNIDQQFAERVLSWFNPRGLGTEQIGMELTQLYRSKADSPLALAGMVTPAGKATTLEKALPWIAGGAVALGLSANAKPNIQIDASRFDLTPVKKSATEAGETFVRGGFNILKSGVTVAAVTENAKDRAVSIGTTKAQELWEGTGGSIQLPGAYNLPKIADVPPAVTYQAPGTGFGKQVDLPAIGFQGLIRAPGFGRDIIAKVSGAVATPRPESGAGGNIGIVEVIQMPKSTIEPADLVTPVYGYTGKQQTIATPQSIVSDRAIFDLSVGSEAKSTVKTREQVISDYSYANKMAQSESSARSNAIATPFWWTQADYASKVAVQNIGVTDISISTGQISSRTSMQPATKSLAQITSQAALQSSLAQSIGTTTSTWWDTLTNTQGRWSPKSDLKLRLPWFDFPSGGGVGGGGGKRKKFFKETFRMGLDLSFPLITVPRGVSPPAVKKTRRSTKVKKRKR